MDHLPGLHRASGLHRAVQQLTISTQSAQSAVTITADGSSSRIIVGSRVEASTAERLLSPAANVAIVCGGTRSACKEIRCAGKW